QEVWRRREDYRLTIRTYREIGGIEGALQRKAGAGFEGVTPEQQELCPRGFLGPGPPGGGGGGTARRGALPGVLPPPPPPAARRARSAPGGPTPSRVCSPPSGSRRPRARGRWRSPTRR